MKALVTGGTGFVGSHIARMLVQDGHSVRILHRKSSKLDALAGLEYESAFGDILDLEALRAACAVCDWVFHVAAVADYWRSDRSKMYEANIEGTRRVLQAAREAGVKRVVFTSSGAAIGMQEESPPDENVPFNLPENAFPYGYSKMLAEKVVAEAVVQGQDVVIVNPSVVMGPGDLNMISGSFITQIKQLQWLTPVTTGGIAVIDVRDVARAHISAAERGRTGERYILNTANYPYKEWFGMIAEAAGVAKPFIVVPKFVPSIVAVLIKLVRRVGISTPVDAAQARLGRRKVYFDASKAWAELGKPQIDMAQSLKDTYEWYLENGYIKVGLQAKLIGGLGRVVGKTPKDKRKD